MLYKKLSLLVMLPNNFFTIFPDFCLNKIRLPLYFWRRKRTTTNCLQDKEQLEEVNNETHPKSLQQLPHRNY
jgi:hypothetical protein